MKISHIGPVNQVKNYGLQQDKSEKADKGKKGDRLSLSDKAQGLQKIKDRVDYKPQIRQEKVSNLKKQINQGTYDVSGKEIAGEILDRIIE
jgi:negative regulator of flagellin synthesis FlgM